jgi:tetratricopeptide (TPR) repeat protein
MRVGVLRLGATAFACLAYAQDVELRKAAKFDAANRCNDAELLYLQAIAKAPSSVAVLNNIGNHYLICGNPEQAEAYFKRLLKINPLHTNANLQLARVSTQRKQGAIALSYLASVKDESPGVRLLRAEASHHAGHHEDTLRILGEVERQAGSDLRVLFALGVTCARVGLYSKAEAAFTRVLAERPDDFNVLLNVGRAAARAKHYDRALRALEVAVKMQPEDADALLELGLVHAALQDYGRSVYVLAQARQHASKRPDVLLALARAAEDAGFYGDSVLAYDEYLQILPKDDSARRDRARVLGYTSGRLSDAIRELALYVHRHPQDSIGYYYLGQLTWMANKPQEALEQLSTALRLDVDLAAAYYSRGWLLHRLGRTPDALGDFKAAARLQPENVRVLDQLGLMYLSVDQPAEAEKVLRRALNIAPRDREVLLHLGRSLVALNREDEAQSFLNDFQKLRSHNTRSPRRDAGMFELATMSPEQRMQLQIRRLREDARTHPSDPELSLHLAGLLLANGQTEEALAVYGDLLTRNADSSIWERAGKSLARAGQYQMARDFLKRAAADNPVLRLDLAIAVYFADGADQALQVMEEVSEKERDGDYLLMKARILDAAGRSEAAETSLQEGMRRASTRADVAQQAALLLIRWNRFKEALRILGGVSRVDPDNPDLMLGQAIILALMERTQDAEHTLKQIESRWPEWDRAYTAHGLLLESTGRNSEARQKLQMAIVLGSKEVVTKCALARLGRESGFDAQCACVTGLRDLVVPACR